jgi:ribonucleoside-triphosphate reductase
MRKLEDIDKDIEVARQELSNVKGRVTEVYSRIVGYYRSVRNWNKGKREEYGERRLYDVETSTVNMETRADNIKEFVPASEPHILLFVRQGCPACPGVKAAVERLGVLIDTIDTSSEAGFAEAARRNVLSTPTVILLDKYGEELRRVHDIAGVASLGRFLSDSEPVEYKNAASM